MEDKEKALLSLLRNAMWGSPSDISGATDWDAVLLLARQQTVLGLVAEAVKNLPEESRPGIEHMRRLQHHMLTSYHAHAMLDGKLAEVVAFLNQHGISPVLFKGQGLARNYPDPVLRQCGDIDLYVGKDYDKACSLVIDAFGTSEHNLESIKHMHLDSDGVTIELHRIAEHLPGLIQNKRFQQWTIFHLQQSKRRQVNIRDVSVELPPYNFDAIYIMNHTWHHFVNGGIGLRQLCDWVLYLHRFHAEIDPVVLRKDLKRMGLLKVWYLFGNIAVNHLGLPVQECPLYEGRYSNESDKMLDRILEEGNFGRYSKTKKIKRPEGYAEGKFHSFKTTTKRYFYNFPIYPSYMLKSWIHFVVIGVYHFLKGL